MDDKYVGEVINNYKIINLSDIKAKDGHKTYDIKCIKCGYTKNNAQLSSIIKNKNNNCYHYTKSVKWHNHRLMSIFNNMILRCYDISCKDYRFYGNNGIIICNEWINNKQLFNDWSINNGYADNLTIDRIDETKNYCPENCRWVTMKENSKWKSTTNEIDVDGIVDSGRGWSVKLGLGINYINRYLRNNGIDKCTIHIRELLNT